MLSTGGGELEGRGGAYTDISFHNINNCIHEIFTIPHNIYGYIVP